MRNGTGDTMSSLISLIIAIIMGLLMLSVGVSDSSEQAKARPVVVSDSLVIEDESIERLALSSSDADAAYVASSESLFLLAGSNDWKRVGEAPPTGQIVFASDDSQVMLVGNQGACARGGGGDVLQRSEDGGVTWAEIPGESMIEPLAVWSESGTAVGASCEGLLVSEDLGDTWERVDEDLLGLEVTAFAVIEGSDHEILAGLTGEGGTSRLYRFDLSDPETWSDAEPLAEYWGIAGIAGTDDLIYLASITGVASSKDNGQTWSSYRLGLEQVTLELDPVTEGLPNGMDLTEYGLNSLYLSNGSPLLVGADSDIFEFWNTDVRPSDAAEWEITAHPGSPVTSFASIPSGEGVLAQADGEVWLVYPGSWGPI